MKITHFRILGFSVLLYFFFFTPQLFAGPTYYVNCDVGRSLQDKINSAKEGAWIGVYGTCTEEIFINNDRISIEGKDGASISAPTGSNSAIEITGSNVHVRGFRIIGGKYQAIRVTGNNAVIRYNEISNVIGDGITLSNNSSAWIYKNLIEDVEVGITIYSSSSAGIDSNDIKNTRGTGIAIGNASNGTITNNFIAATGAGIWIRTSASARIVDNDIEGYQFAIGVVESSSADIWGNTISSDKESGGIGGIVTDENSTTNLPSLDISRVETAC